MNREGCPIFPHKMKGKKAVLYAELCEHFLEGCADECNDTPRDSPVFAGLSRQQRIHLVRDLATGLLCEDEPMPPSTLQHLAAHHGLMEYLITQIIVEVESAFCFSDDVREELFNVPEEWERQSEGQIMAGTKQETMAVKARAYKIKTKLENEMSQASSSIPIPAEAS